MTLEEEIVQLLTQLTDCNDALSRCGHVGGSATSHTLARHRDILNEFTQVRRLWLVMGIDGVVDAVTSSCGVPRLKLGPVGYVIALGIQARTDKCQQWAAESAADGHRWASR